MRLTADYRNGRDFFEGTRTSDYANRTDAVVEAFVSNARIDAWHKHRVRQDGPERPRVGSFAVDLVHQRGARGPSGANMISAWRHGDAEVLHRILAHSFQRFSVLSEMPHRCAQSKLAPENRRLSPQRPDIFRCRGRRPHRWTERSSRPTQSPRLQNRAAPNARR